MVRKIISCVKDSCQKNGELEPVTTNHRATESLKNEILEKWEEQMSDAVFASVGTVLLTVFFSSRYVIFEKKVSLKWKEV